MTVQTEFITSIDRLDHVTSFLEKGYGWSLGEKERLTYLIRENNQDDFKIYGLESYDENGVTKAAILFIYQGEVMDGEEKKQVINVSSWYHEPDFRGKEAYKFTEKMIEKLSDKIVTSYTCSKAAIKIYRVSGFNGLRVKKTKLYIWQTLSQIFKKCFITEQADIKSLFGNLLPVKGFNKLYDHKVVKIKLPTGSLKVLYGIRKSSRGKFNVLTIYWTDNHELLIRNLPTISGRLMLKTLSLLAYTYSQEEHDKDNIMSCNWLMYGAKHAIPPIQSELSYH